MATIYDFDLNIVDIVNPDNQQLERCRHEMPR